MISQQKVLALNEAVKAAAEKIIAFAAIHRDFHNDLVATLNELYQEAVLAALDDHEPSR